MIDGTGVLRLSLSEHLSIAALHRAWVSIGPVRIDCAFSPRAWQLLGAGRKGSRGSGDRTAHALAARVLLFTEDERPTWFLVGDRRDRGDAWILDSQVWCELPHVSGFLLADGTNRLGAFLLRDPDIGFWRAVRFVAGICLPRLSGLLIHASGVATPDGVVLFCGPSGRGKTTLAVELTDGRTTFTVDRAVAVVDSNGRWWAYSTPFSDGDAAERIVGPMPIRGIFEIRQSSQVRVDLLDHRDALRSILRNVTLVEPSEECARLTLSLADRLSSSVRCGALGFDRSARFWAVIEDILDRPERRLKGHD